MLKRAHWIALFHYIFATAGFVGMAVCFFSLAFEPISYSCGGTGMEERDIG